MEKVSGITSSGAIKLEIDKNVERERSRTNVSLLAHFVCFLLIGLLALSGW